MLSLIACPEGWMADVPVSAPQTQVARLEATIRSAQTLLEAGLNDEAMKLLAAFSAKDDRYGLELTKDHLIELCNSNPIPHAIVT